jgi:hypothetical protein
VAGVLVGIILVFIVCHSFKFFVNIYEAYIIYFGKKHSLTLWRVSPTNIYPLFVFVGKEDKYLWDTLYMQNLKSIALIMMTDNPSSLLHSFAK